MTIKRAIELQPALNRLVAMEEHNRTRSARLKRYQLTRQEWGLLTQLYPLLEVCSSSLCLHIITADTNSDILTGH